MFKMEFDNSLLRNILNSVKYSDLPKGCQVEVKMCDIQSFL